jgi:tetrapyrrole methylase family protein/MazG family protein
MVNRAGREASLIEPENQDLRSFTTLVAITKKLRSPGGCPWDREQTHASLRGNLLEEAYETLEALDTGDPPAMAEESGDLLMQIVLHAQIASETHEYDIGDVIEKINKKLIFRHPHVFGDVKVSGTGEVLKNWQELKQKTKPKDASIIGSVPRSLPALAYAQEIQYRVAQAGFDWKKPADIIDKLGEEIAELKEAPTKERQAQEFGDLLFTLVNIARRQGIDVEAALRETNERFFKRFTCMEKLARERGQTFDSLSFAAQNALWEEAKTVVG